MLNDIRLSLALGLFAVACQTADGPVDPVWGKQLCSTCRMIVSEPAYAAQLIDQGGKRHFFDDIGCMDAFLVEHSKTPPRGTWVRSNERWVDATSARYASGARSPMDYGFVPKEQGPLDFASVRREAAAHRKEKER